MYCITQHIHTLYIISEKQKIVNNIPANSLPYLQNWHFSQFCNWFFQQYAQIYAFAPKKPQHIKAPGLNFFKILFIKRLICDPEY